MILGYVLLAIVVITLGVAIYIGTGGRAWFGTHEVPKNLIGRTVRLVDCEWISTPPLELPPATVTAYTSPDYRLDFVIPFSFEGREEHFVHIRSRHEGYPVSNANRMPVWVGATLESGRQFIAKLVVSSSEMVV